MSGVDTTPDPASEAALAAAQAAFQRGEFEEAANAARALLDKHGSQSPAFPARTAALAVSVVAAAEIAHFEQALVHLQQLLSAAVRGSFDDYVRARGTAATCFALLGDPWAGQRLLSELLGLFQGLPSESALEAMARNKHATVCLQIVRLARDAGDLPSATEALDHADSSIQRVREIADRAGDDHLAVLADVQASEVVLLRGDAVAALGPLRLALEQAATAGLPTHERYLRVVLAEACLGTGEPERALLLAQEVDGALREGHELGLRIRCIQVLQRGHEATGDVMQTLSQAARVRTLEQYRLYQQLRTQSRFLRTRLELEHLYRYQANASRSLSSRPGALTMPAPLDSEPPAEP